jgi:hypothetical protein
MDFRHKYASGGNYRGLFFRPCGSLKSRMKYDKNDNKNSILFERVIVAQMQGGRFRPDHRRTVVRQGLGEADNAADDRKTRSK